jgi:hypothetical protein
MEGVVVRLDLLTLKLRSATGEIYVIPNVEIRVIRNFSRGRFSTANIIISLGAEDISRGLPLLTHLGREAVALIPDLLEPWRVISETGELNMNVKLTLITKIRFGKAAELRPQLLALVKEQLAGETVDLNP